MRVIAAEKVDPHVVQYLIKFVIFAEIVAVDPHTHTLATRVTGFNYLSSEFQRGNVDSSTLTCVD